MFTNLHITDVLVADHQRSLRNEARQHHLGRIARLARRGGGARSARSTPDARPAHRPELPPAAALAAWKQDQRAV
jgi:hypothetical protein